MGVFWLMTMIGILVGNIVGAFMGLMVACYLGWGACRDILGGVAGARVALRNGAVVVSTLDGTGGCTLRYGAGSGAVEVEILGLFLVVVRNRVGNGRIVRHVFWMHRWSR